MPTARSICIYRFAGPLRALNGNIGCNPHSHAKDLSHAGLLMLSYTVDKPAGNEFTCRVEGVKWPTRDLMVWLHSSHPLGTLRWGCPKALQG